MNKESIIDQIKESENIMTFDELYDLVDSDLRINGFDSQYIYLVEPILNSSINSDSYVQINSYMNDIELIGNDDDLIAEFGDEYNFEDEEEE